MRAKIVKQAKLALAGPSDKLFFLCGIIQYRAAGLRVKVWSYHLLRHGIHLLIREGFVQNMSTTIPIKIRILGSGTSTGVPVVGCGCAVCLSPEPRNKRLRTSILITRRDTQQQILIDTTPDFRQQMLDAQVSRLDEVLYTHTHADHCHGFDDLRSLYFHSRKPVRCWIWQGHEQDLTGRFSYAFQARTGYAGTAPQVDLRTFAREETLSLLGFEIETRLLPHGHMESVAYRFGDFLYATDFHHFPDEVAAAWKGRVTTMIGSGLRFEPHPSHSTIDETVELFRELGVTRGYLTHMSHAVEHVRDSKKLPANVTFAYDGLEFDLDVKV